MARTSHDTIVDLAQSLGALGSRLDSESEGWTLPVGANSFVDYAELERRGQFLWLIEVEAGATLLKLTKLRAFEVHPPIEHVIFQRRAGLKKQGRGGEGTLTRGVRAPPRGC